MKDQVEKLAKANSTDMEPLVHHSFVTILKEIDKLRKLGIPIYVNQKEQLKN